MEIASPPPESDGSAFVAPRILPYLSNNSLAHDLIDELRWNGVTPVCPRCRSKYTKQVNTNVFRQLYRCIDCGYMFNSLAGTIFHGSKMPVSKYLHFFVLHNALKTNLTLRDLGYALDVSYKTASLLMKRVTNISYNSQFAKVDKKRSLARADQDEDGDNREAAFFSYCDIKSVVINDALFRQFLQQLTQGIIEGIDHIETDH